MRIAIIGAGNVGMTLGHGWVREGHEVVFGVRVPAGREVTVGRVAGIAEAVREASVVVLATPWAAVESALSTAGSLDGKLLIDCTNPILPGLAGLAVGTTESAAERIAALAPGARVVKALNTTGAANMANPRYGTERLTMFYCGDDAEAKQTVDQLLAALGFAPVDAGGLEAARYLEPLAMLWIHLAYRLGNGPDIGLQLLRR
jgi:8-hydroxy-5-deazaflavin:NADPH oxidoreductase